jgi:hypothetical protein
MPLLLLDSRSRANIGDNASICKFKLTPAIDKIRHIQLLSFDLPVPSDAATEGVFYVSVAEFGNNVRAIDELDSGTFVIFRQSAAGARTQTFEQLTFIQEFDLPQPRAIQQLNCRVSYRNTSNEVVLLTADWNMLIKYN